MAVTKINGFVAPYRSATFQGQANGVVQTSGLLKMDGVISNGSGNIIVPPFQFIQNGLIVSVSEEKFVTDPEKEAPYYLAVSAATTAPVDDLSFQLPKSPSDISTNQVLIGYWDGNEWRKPQLVSIAEIYKSINQANIDNGNVGILSGLDTVYSVPNYINHEGIIVDRQGLKQTLTEDAIFTEVVEDDYFDRVDRIIYRRADDSVNRIGLRKFILGGTHAVDITKVAETEFIDDSFVNSSVKVLIGSDNLAHIFVARGYGTSFSLVYCKYSSDRTTQLIAPTEIITGLDKSSFDVCIDDDNHSHIFYSKNSDLYYARRNVNDNTVDINSLLHNHPSGIVSNPSCVYSSNLNAVFIVTKVTTSILPPASVLYFQSIACANSLSIRKAPAELNFISGVLDNPHITITDDEDIYVVAENTATARVWLRKYDDIALPLSEAVDVSLATKYGVTVLTGDAHSPKVLVSDNKSVFVTFLQNKSSDYGMAVWNDGTAEIVDLTSPTEDLAGYDVTIDSFMNGLHFIVNDISSTNYVKVEGYVKQFSKTLSLAPSSSMSLARDKRGSMLHVYSLDLATTFTTYAAAKPIPYIGSQLVSGTENSLYLGAGQLLVSTAGGFSPKVGDKVIISGANTASVIVEDKELSSINAVGDYWLLTFSAAFVTATGDLADFQNPDGNSVTFCKTNSELTSKAYRFDVLDTDILLSRISLPGPVILNTVDEGTGPTPSGVEKLVAFGSEVEIEWTVINTLKITGGLGVHDLGNNYTYTFVDGEYALAEGEALYVELDLSNPTPTPQAEPVATLDWTKNIQVLGVVEGGNFVPHYLLSSLAVEELEPGEVVFTGHDLPDIIRERIGIISDTQFAEYAVGFDNVCYNINQDDTYPEAIHKLDVLINAIHDDNNNEYSYTVPVGGITELVCPLFFWESDNEEFDIMVFVNGKKQTQDKTGTGQKDYQKTETDTIEFSYTVPEGAEITIFKVRDGGGAPGFLTIQEENVDVNGNCKVLNFMGTGVSASYGGAGKVNVYISGSGGGSGSSITKVYRNVSGDTIPAVSAVAFDDNGGIVPADTNIASLSDFAGVTVMASANTDYVDTVKLGDMPGVLTGMGAMPGDLIYLGETPGTLSLTPPSGLYDTILVVGRAEPESGENPDGTATALFISPQIISVGA